MHRSTHARERYEKGLAKDRANDPCLNCTEQTRCIGESTCCAAWRCYAEGRTYYVRKGVKHHYESAVGASMVHIDEYFDTCKGRTVRGGIAA